MFDFKMTLQEFLEICTPAEYEKWLKAWEEAELDAALYDYQQQQ